MIIDLNLNGEPRTAIIDIGDRLIDVLIHQFGLESLDMDCVSGHCGRCLVYLDGRLVYSCLVPAFKAKDSKVVTVEGLKATDEFKDVEAGFFRSNLVTCGFCENAKKIAAFDLLNRNPLPSDLEILEQMDLISCGCTDPQNMTDAVHAASEVRKHRKFNREKA